MRAMERREGAFAKAASRIKALKQVQRSELLLATLSVYSRHIFAQYQEDSLGERGERTEDWSATVGRKNNS